MRNTDSRPPRAFSQVRLVGLQMLSAPTITGNSDRCGGIDRVPKKSPRPAGEGFLGAAGSSNDAVAAQALDLAGIDAEPAVQHCRAVASEFWRAFQPHRLAVDAHRPGC